MGIRVPWKKAVTVSQIVQFVIDLFVVFFASYNYWAFNKWGMQKYTLGSCSGTEYAALSGMGVLSSYLVLFILCACPSLLLLASSISQPDTPPFSTNSLPEDVLAKEGKAGRPGHDGPVAEEGKRKVGIDSLPKCTLESLALPCRSSLPLSLAHT